MMIKYLNVSISLCCSIPMLIVVVFIDTATSSYGDMPAHNLLWRECEKSSGDVAARLAAIPLVQVTWFSETLSHPSNVDLRFL